jgi:hypothetical protein
MLQWAWATSSSCKLRRPHDESLAALDAAVCAHTLLGGARPFPRYRLGLGGSEEWAAIALDRQQAMALAITGQPKNPLLTALHLFFSCHMRFP